MAIVNYDNTPDGRTQVAAVPDPKHIWVVNSRRITVFTGGNIPTDEAVANPTNIVLTTRQLIQGADAIARAHALAIEGYIRGIVGVDAKDPADQIPATGNYSQIKYWKWHNATIRRGDAQVNALRVALGWNNALMDSIFVAGSGMDQ